VGDLIVIVAAVMVVAARIGPTFWVEGRLDVGNNRA
jgi:hypothetical protein